MTTTSKLPVAASPPEPGEYMPAAIKKAVVNTGLKHPLTVYPVALGISSGIVGWLFDMPTLFTAMVAGVVLGPVWAIISIFFRHQRLGSNYIRKLNQRQKAYERYLQRQILSGLRSCRRIRGIRDLARIGDDQFKNITKKFKNVQDLLEMKLKRGEITFGRFSGAAEQVSLSVLDNLSKVAGLLKSAGSIEPDAIHRRLDELAQKKPLTEEEKTQESALKTRLALWDEQLKKANGLLTKNEEAMTEMEKISAAVAEWQTNGHFADTDFESAISRLHELAERAHEYNF